MRLPRRRARPRSRALPAFVITLVLVLGLLAAAFAWWDSHRSASRTAKNKLRGQVAGVEKVLEDEGFSCYETVSSRPGRDLVRSCYRTAEGPVMVGVSLTGNENGEVRALAVRSTAVAGGDASEPFRTTVKVLDRTVLSDQLAVMTRPKGRVEIGWGTGELSDSRLHLRRKGVRPVTPGTPVLSKSPRIVLAGFGKGGMKCVGRTCRGSLWGSTVVEVRDLGGRLSAKATVKGEPDAVNTALRKFLGDVLRQFVPGEEIRRWLDANVDPPNGVVQADFSGYHLTLERTANGDDTEAFLTVSPAVPVVIPGR